MHTTMYFAGSDGVDDTKGIIDEDKPINLVIIDESTEFFDDGEREDELLNIETTFARGNKGGFCHMIAFFVAFFVSVLFELSLTRPRDSN